MTKVESIKASNVIGLIAEASNQRPDKNAVVCEDQALSYAELVSRSDQLAVHLSHRGVSEGTLVGIYVERSIDMLVGLLGILKSGGAYVPLDPAYPGDRIAYMLEHSRAPVVLTQASLREALPDGDFDTLCLDSDWDNIASSEGTASGQPRDQAPKARPM